MLNHYQTTIWEKSFFFPRILSESKKRLCQSRRMNTKTEQATVTASPVSNIQTPRLGLRLQHFHMRDRSTSLGFFGLGPGVYIYYTGVCKLHSLGIQSPSENGNGSEVLC